jgi:hypothetical protein
MISAMVCGRLKEPAKWRLTENKKALTTGTMIATDEANRAQVIALETLDDDIGRGLRKLQAGASVTVTGAATLSPLGGLKIRVRTLQTIQATSAADVTPAAVATSV